MPTIPDIPGPYRFFFYSLDCNEPPHVHVQRDRAVAKFWLDRLQLAESHGFPAHETNRIRRIIFEHRFQIVEAWRAHCGENE